MSKPEKPETTPTSPKAGAAPTADGAAAKDSEPAASAEKEVSEIGGPKGLEPTRYGDWERKGRCIDF